MTDPVLEVRVRLALDRFDLAVDLATGEQVTAVFGPSGSGKTSLLETVAGLRRRAQGVIRCGGDTWLDSDAGVFRRPERRQVGLVPQDGLLFPHMDVRANLVAGRKRAAQNGAPYEESLDNVVEVLELGPLLGRAVTTLSGGERQRVALGRALCSGPRLLLFDEPLAALDLPLRRRLLPFLARVRDEFRIPTLLVSHDPLEVQALCDDVLVLSEGRQLARGVPNEVLSDPAVFPLAESGGFENVLRAVVVESSEHTSVVRLGESGSDVRLVTGRSTAAPGEKLLVGVPADQIIVAMEEPRGLSARNVVRATVRELRHAERLGLLTASLGAGAPDLVVELTETSAADLALAPGKEVYLVVKATACRLYDGAR